MCAVFDITSVGTVTVPIALRLLCPVKGHLDKYNPGLGSNHQHKNSGLCEGKSFHMYRSEFGTAVKEHCLIGKTASVCEAFLLDPNWEMVSKNWGLIGEGSAPTLLLRTLELQLSLHLRVQHSDQMIRVINSLETLNSLISEDEAANIGPIKSLWSENPKEVYYFGAK